MNDEDFEHLRITETAAGIVMQVHVQPRASRNEICGIHGHEIRLRLTSPPVDDAANRMCVEFMAKRLGVSRAAVTIIAGGRSRHKTLCINGVTSQDIRALFP